MCLIGGDGFLGDTIAVLYEESCIMYVCLGIVYDPIYQLDKLGDKDKDKADKEDEEEPIGVSPCGR